MRQRELEGRVKDEEPKRTFGQEYVCFVKAENPTCLGIDEAECIASWDKVKDGPKKRETMEKKLKKLQAVQAELCMMRIGFTAQAANVMFKQDNASSSG